MWNGRATHTHSNATRETKDNRIQIKYVADEDDETNEELIYIYTHKNSKCNVILCATAIN